MGTALSFLLENSHSNDVVDALLRAEPRSWMSVRELWMAHGFFRLPDAGHWYERESGSEMTESHRPSGPSLSLSLELPSGFCVTFQQHATAIYHPVNFLRFVKEPAWRKSLLASLVDFALILSPTRGYICSDDFSGHWKFYRGGSYDDCLFSDNPNEGAVNSIDDLIRYNADGFWFPFGFIPVPFEDGVVHATEFLHRFDDTL